MSDSSDDCSAGARPGGPVPSGSCTPAGARLFPGQGRLIGLDYGTRRIGVAVSTPDQKIASPVESYARAGNDNDARHLKELAHEYEAVGLVVGLPVHMSGQEGEKAREARKFGQWLHDELGLPVCYWDERFTTAQAEGALMDASLGKSKRKARLDKVAAQIMLQAFLDAPDRDVQPGAMTE